MLFVFHIIIILTYGTYHITTITRERFNRIIPAICETAQFMVQDIIIKVLEFLICFILVTIGMIIMITGKGGNDCDRIKYFIYNH